MWRETAGGADSDVKLLWALMDLLCPEHCGQRTSFSTVTVCAFAYKVLFTATLIHGYNTGGELSYPVQDIIRPGPTKNHNERCLQHRAIRWTFRRINCSSYSPVSVTTLHVSRLSTREVG